MNLGRHWTRYAPNSCRPSVVSACRVKAGLGDVGSVNGDAEAAVRMRGEREGRERGGGGPDGAGIGRTLLRGRCCVHMASSVYSDNGDTTRRRVSYEPCSSCSETEGHGCSSLCPATLARCVGAPRDSGLSWRLMRGGHVLSPTAIQRQASTGPPHASTRPPRPSPSPRPPSLAPRQHTRRNTMSTDDAPHSVIFDSLPYYDNDLERDSALKDKAERLIARELKPQQGLHPRVPPPVTLFAVRAPQFPSVISEP